MKDRAFAKTLFVIVLGGIVAWQVIPVMKPDPMAEKRRLWESCSPHHEDLVKWEMITGSAATAMDLANSMQNICLTGTPRSEAIEAVNSLVMPRRRI